MSLVRNEQEELIILQKEEIELLEDEIIFLKKEIKVLEEKLNAMDRKYDPRYIASTPIDTSFITFPYIDRF